MKRKVRKKERKANAIAGALGALVPDDELRIEVDETSYRFAVTVTHLPTGTTAPGVASIRETVHAAALAALHDKLRRG